MNALLDIRNVSTYFYTGEGIVKAVDDVSLRIKEGETVCVVGESGCGKSVTAMSVMGLLPEPSGRIVSGEIRFDGQDIRQWSKEQLRRLRGNEIAIVFQEPMSAMNPVLTIGKQMTEPLREHLHLKEPAARAKAVELLNLVGIPRAEAILNAYPHELSGGMLQRVMIATALACRPRLLIADEPTTASDVTIQAQILDILHQVKEEMQTAILLITHDLGIVAEMADYVVVMYAGKIVEEAPVEELFDRPQHPYTQGLLRSKPVLHQRRKMLYSIPGQVPNPLELGSSCYFYDRCDQQTEACRTAHPELRRTAPDHSVACWLYGEGEERHERSID
ncbi:ABC transporter ATP-binding protein [Paenibacillus dendritiformis]|uniref:ABC transporter ATP-binding protein n=1 Tax=Paenibacillus dendritiformis TaxID=130049 RepID=UPI00105A5098|nr:ABC transporter ATP-binding protein [Paenibacillus dendritiformis]TDL57879.1 ABC transporter ATP-binding protein [Paenibacillus dendritiformis]